VVLGGGFDAKPLIEVKECHDPAHIFAGILNPEANLPVLGFPVNR
jgi:hypothetical protein